MTGTRHKARTIALQALYEADMAGHEPGEVATRLMGETELPAEHEEFAAGLVAGVVQNREEIDGHIRHFAPTWPLEQIAVIDRNILRLAIFEILFDNKVPVKVAVSEAVELAKSFGSANSSKFVNGVLGSVSVLASR